MEPIRILVNGAQGKMGQETVKAIQQNPELELVGQSGKTDNLAALINSSKANVVVDFTTPHAAYENMLTIINNGAHPVMGTTGFTPEQLTELTQRCNEKKLGALIAPNFSIGAILMMQFSEQAARFYPNVEIIEFHHPGKMDAPSGTAIKTAEMIKAARTETPTINQPTRETFPGSRGALGHNIPIHAIRLPGFVASQEVIFGNQGETLTIRQNTIHREAFMPGVLLACKKVINLEKLIYGLEYLLNS